MTFKFKYKLTHSFTGRDIEDVAAPEIEYTVLSHRPDGWTQKILDFRESEWQNAGLACEILAGLIDHITYEGKQYPATIEDVTGWRDMAEEQAPGQGDSYICKLATAVWLKQREFEDDRLGNFETPPEPSSNGTSGAKSKQAVKPAT